MFPSKLHQIVTLILIAFLVPVAGGTGVGASNAQTQNRAGLVVQFADGSTQTYCFAFPSDTISGLELLQKTGLPMKVEGSGAMGALICKLGPDGCDYPGEPCVCKSYGPGGVYWSYHHLRNGVWKSSVQGASSYRVKPGEVDGWAWSAGKPPPVFTFEQLCAAQPAPSPTPTARNIPPSPTTVPTRPPATSTPPRLTPTTRPSHTTPPTRRPAVATRTPTTRRAQPSITPAAPKSPTLPRRTSTPIPSITPIPTSTNQQPAASSQQPSIGATWLLIGVQQALVNRGGRVE